MGDSHWWMARIGVWEGPDRCSRSNDMEMEAKRMDLSAIYRYWYHDIVAENWTENLGQGVETRAGLEGKVPWGSHLPLKIMSIVQGRNFPLDHNNAPAT